MTVFFEITSAQGTPARIALQPGVQRIKSAIERLKPEYSSVLLLWGVEGMKYREIAEIQDIPIGTVMSRLHRARSILAEELADLAEEKRLTGGSIDIGRSASHPAGK